MQFYSGRGRVRSSAHGASTFYNRYYKPVLGWRFSRCKKNCQTMLLSLAYFNLKLCLVILVFQEPHWFYKGEHSQTRLKAILPLVKMHCHLVTDDQIICIVYCPSGLPIVHRVQFPAENKELCIVAHDASDAFQAAIRGDKSADKSAADCFKSDNCNQLFDRFGNQDLSEGSSPELCDFANEVGLGRELSALVEALKESTDADSSMAKLVDKMLKLSNDGADSKAVAATTDTTTARTPVAGPVASSDGALSPPTFQFGSSPHSSGPVAATRPNNSPTAPGPAVSNGGASPLPAFQFGTNAANTSASGPVAAATTSNDTLAPAAHPPDSSSSYSAFRLVGRPSTGNAPVPDRVGIPSSVVFGSQTASQFGSPLNFAFGKAPAANNTRRRNATRRSRR